MKRIQQSFSLLLGGQPLKNFGARATLAMKRQQRAVPFTPISVFGFQLDENGPETNGPQLSEEPGADCTGVQIQTRN
ncbi:MAG: hypothetical protein BVN33_14805 [Proteobacteria bacterium ST_bin13]|nr:MAG: hypothetical protein BVN33_14805 [Proteobacteria bacterium ST_bin13]